MSQDDNFEIDTAPASVADDTEETVDTRPVWDIEYKAGDGGGVVEIHANSAEDARAQFLGRYPENAQPEVLSVEPG